MKINLGITDKEEDILSNLIELLQELNTNDHSTFIEGITGEFIVVGARNDLMAYNMGSPIQYINSLWFNDKISKDLYDKAYDLADKLPKTFKVSVDK